MASAAKKPPSELAVVDGVVPSSWLESHDLRASIWRRGMEGWGRPLSSAVAPPGIGSLVPRSLLAVLLLYSFSSQFLPIEPYLVPYLTSVKNFSNSQVTVDIYPISVYSQLVSTLLLAPACYFLSHKLVIVLGAFAVLVTYIIIWAGKSLLAMQIMQMTYGFGMSARLVFSSYIFVLVPEEDYQTMTSLTTTTSLVSFMLASEIRKLLQYHNTRVTYFILFYSIGQLLALEEVSYEIFLAISLIALGICCVMAFLLPKDRSLCSLSSLTISWDQNEGWILMMKETWQGRSLQMLSLWWAIAFAGFSLVQNYGMNLFDVIDPKAKYNGHILAASQAAGSLGSYGAIYIESFARKSGLIVYILGSASMGILCVCMGVFSNIWAAYSLYIAISGIYQTLACLVSVRCGRLLSNGQFILLFSINNFAGLLIETSLQAVVELSGFSIFTQYISFASFFFLATTVFVGLSFINGGKPNSREKSESDSEYFIIDKTCENSLRCETTFGNTHRQEGINA